MDRTTASHPLPYLATVLAVAGLYVAAAKLGLSMAFVAEQVTAVWPPTGIALAVLLVLGRRLWPGIALGAFVANVTANESIGTACGIAAGNTLEAIVGAGLLQRLGVRRSLERLRDVLALVVLAAGVSTTVSATIGVMSLCLGGAQPWAAFGSLWWTWWLGDAMGDLVMAPLLLVWAGSARWVSAARTRWRWDRVAEALALIGALAAVSVVVFGGRFDGGSTRYPLEYTIFPFVIWAALRFGQRGTVTVTFVAALLAIVNMLGGAGPFAIGTAHESLIMLQLFMAVVATTGLVLGAAITERDIAERRRAADYAALWFSEERFRLAIEAGQMGVWDWDIATGRVTWSENLEAIHGLAPGRFAGTFDAFRELVHPEDRAFVDRSITRAVDEGTGYDVEFRNLWPDGSVHWIAGKGRLFGDRGGQAVRMIGVGMDITERKRLEEELRRRAQQLADADRQKDEFLAMLAHELRNPLAPIANAVELLALRRDNATAVEEARALIQRQVRNMARLVDDLLDVSRITSGKIKLQKEPVELQRVVSNAVATARPLLAARGHELVVSLPPEPVRLEADPTRLEQIVANLLSNAAKFTEDGGRVWLDAEQAGDEVLIRVRDTGVGMSAAMLARAFDLFTQGEHTPDRAKAGLGIGLTLVRRLVELHAGSVTGESAGPGAGSAFTVRLPALREARELTDGAAPGRPPHPTTPPPQARVLVVDDNVDTAESLGMLLEIDGYDVQTAHTGPDAIEAARAFAPDVVLLDIGLPGMDGYAVARVLRADPVLARCLLIAISGYGQDEDRRRSREAGFDDHLVKPVERDTLQPLLAAEQLTRRVARA